MQFVNDQIYRAWISASNTSAPTSTTSGGIFQTWATNSTSLSSSTTTSSDTWVTWTGGNTLQINTVASGSTQVWSRWVQIHPDGRITAAPRRTAVDQRITAEDLALREEERQRQMRLHAEAAQAKKVAEERSKVLLMECLNDEQRRTLERDGFFDVRIADGRTFRIHKGYQHNVRRVDGGKEREDYCAHIDLGIPVYDNMLAQKLTLQHNPEEFFRLANVAVRFNRDGVRN